MLRRAMVFAGLIFVCVAGRAADSWARFDVVKVPPAKTSIYVGTVTLTTADFARKKGVYETTYTAKVFPFAFYNESGTLSVEIADEALAKLEAGQPIEFKGRAVTKDGEERRVEGKATPNDGSSGKLKVRVFVTKKTELIFNTNYRFPEIPEKK